MRSRTELVTTTFVDSDDDDYSEDDDSEEDWRPTKKKQQKQARGSGSDGGGRKRKASAAAAAKAKRRAAKVSDDEFESAEEDVDAFEDELDSDPSDEDYEEALDFAVASSSSGPASKQRLAPVLPPKKQLAKYVQMELLLNKRDLMATDWLDNCRLCLWHKDEQTKFLQKYLRVKTNVDNDNEQLLFTSSSVYSSWDEQRINDFITVKVNCLDVNNRRVRLDDLPALQKIAEELQAQANNKRTVETTDENDNEDETVPADELANEQTVDAADEENEEDEELDELDDDDVEETLEDLDA